jgi:hypothetical protein
MRRKGELSSSRRDREWPHQIALKANDVKHKWGRHQRDEVARRACGDERRSVQGGKTRGGSEKRTPKAKRAGSIRLWGTRHGGTGRHYGGLNVEVAAPR